MSRHCFTGKINLSDVPAVVAQHQIGRAAYGDGAAGAFSLVDTKNKLSLTYFQHVHNWDVKIQTWRAEYGYEDRFINYPHDIPANNAEYIITFSKKIGDIERSDKMHIRMTNLGEVIELNAVNYDQSFAPYAELQIDQSKIEEAAWNAFDNIRNNHSIESQKIQNIELVIQDDSLWAQVTIEYSLGETKGGVIYVIQVAELK